MISILSDAQIKMLFGSANKITRSMTGAVKQIGNKRYIDLITEEDLIGGGNLTNKTCNYLKEKGFDVDFYKKERSLNRNRKNKKILPKIPQVKQIEIWEYYAQKVTSGEIVLEDNNSENNEQQQLLDCNPRLVHFCEQHNSGDLLKKLRSSIPVSRESDLTFLDFTYDLVDPDKNWKYLFINHLRRFKSMKEIKELYESTTEYGEHFVSVNNFFNALFNLECKGFGKGEMFCATLIDGATVMGGSEPYDLCISNDLVREVHELKVMNDYGSIRLGKTKLQRYEFSKHINEVFSVAHRLIYKQKIYLGKIVGENLLKLWQLLLNECEPAWIDGEVGEDKLRIFMTFLYHMHNYIMSRNKKTFRTAIVMDVFAGETIRTFSAPVNDDVIYDNDEDALLQFGALRYIQNPDLLLQDLQDTVKEYFNRHVDYITIFRTKGHVVNMCKQDDLVFDTITQSAVKFIESKYSTRKRDQYPEYLAWVRYCEDKTKNYEDLYEEELLK